MPMAFAKNHDPSDSLSSPSSTNSSGHVFSVTNYQPEETHPVIDFKAGLDYVTHKNGSFLSFEQNDDISENYCSIWDENQIRCNYQHSNGSTTSSYGCIRENPHGGEPFGWLNSEENGGTIQEFESNNKRPHKGESTQALKKQCASSTSTRKNKPKSTPPSKDPQSIAAKNRRERITERLKILQELVPNGTKVDLVTMLEKAISYVKFLQLQVKVLATDEFWPVQGGKAPDLSQVKEAIDAILSSQKDRSSKCFLANPR